MVDFAIIKANKPTATPNFHLSPFVWQQHESKSQFVCRKSSPKIALFRGRFFRQKIDLKIKSLHLQQQGHTLTSSWNSLFSFHAYY